MCVCVCVCDCYTITAESLVKESENRSIFSEVMGQSKCPVFFLSTGYI